MSSVADVCDADAINAFSEDVTALYYNCQNEEDYL
jgi:hypothetical protein